MTASTQQSSVASTVLVRRITAGVAGGLTGGVVFGLLMQLMGMIPMVAQLVGSTAVVVGWGVHLVISAVIGAGFGLVGAHFWTGTASAVVAGGGYGIVWWVLGPLLLMPTRLGMPLFTVDAMVYSPSRPVERLFIVKAGRVRTYRTAVDGRSLTTAIVAPGQLFGQMPMLGLRMDDSYAEMLEPGVLCVMSPADVQRLLFSDLRIVNRLTALLGGRLAELETRLTDTVLKPVAARICSALATLAGSPPSPVRLTHDQLADLVGTTRETTTKVLGDLKARSYVRLRRGRIDVLDPIALLELAARGG